MRPRLDIALARAAVNAGGMAIGPTTAGLAGAILVCALLLRIFPDLETVFFLVPGHTLTRPWMVLTSGYFEDSGINLGVGLAALLGCGALLYDTWGDREFVKYVLLTNAAQGCFSWVGMTVLYILFRSEHFLFARLGGLSGVLGGLAVVAKQSSLRRASSGAALPLPASIPAGSPLPQLLDAAMRHAPTACVVWVALLLLMTHAGPPDELLFVLNGLLVGWTYLRYFQPKGDSGACGDAASDFAFAELFPKPLQPPLRVLSHACFILVSSTGVIPPLGWGAEGGAAALDIESGRAGALLSTPDVGLSSLELLRTPLPASASVTTTDPAVAERRRERARALIEARLAGKEPVSMAAADDVELGAGTAVRAAASSPAMAATPAVSAGYLPSSALESPTTPAT